MWILKLSPQKKTKQDRAKQTKTKKKNSEEEESKILSGFFRNGLEMHVVSLISFFDATLELMIESSLHQNVIEKVDNYLFC